MSGDLLSSEQDFTWVSFRFGVAMSREQLPNLQLTHFTPEFVRRIRDNMETMKWLDWQLCQVLICGDTEFSAITALPAVHYYHHEQGRLRQLSSGQFSADEQAPIYCVITTLCHYRRQFQNKFTHYVCHLPVLQSAPPTRLILDVSSDVPNFSTHWGHFLWMANGSTEESFEWTEEAGVGGERVRMADYDCLIFDVDYRESHTDCEWLNALGDILTPQQTFVVTGSMARVRGINSNFDCLKQMFLTLGGFHFRPLSELPNNWRIWCNKYQNYYTTNFVEIVRWACLDIILRRRGTAHP
ncbi:hypothetical protein EmuJ_000178300 [Echinococcus multilocularis]|uniref:Uncharacterized protein n=1 Tax=Echinococcus multilocularis TaxID=6211 RepID=A0A087VZU5_ECHMU|nr:hypothetical protein EmuJ_000178300 [Echinococcus multilocularis]